MSLDILDISLYKALKSDYVGVSFDPVECERGVRISNVDPNGEAASAGLKRWDVLLSINGTVVTEPLSAAELLRESEGSCWCCVERSDDQDLVAGAWSLEVCRDSTGPPRLCARSCDTSGRKADIL